MQYCLYKYITWNRKIFSVSVREEPWIIVIGPVVRGTQLQLPNTRVPFVQTHGSSRTVQDHNRDA